MRPALGTFVEIGLSHDSSPKKFHNAFAAIKKVEDLMSFHDPLSELSRLNSLSIGAHLKVSLETLFVLKKAEELRNISQGAFNVAVGTQLAQWNLLPRHFKSLKMTHSPFLIEGQEIFRINEGLLDLGGIAKGFAVDEAVDAMKGSCQSGFVNAGGDIRVFGEEKIPFHIQMGRNIFHEMLLDNKSMATSTVRRVLWKNKMYVSHHIKSDNTPCLKRSTVTLLADTCIIADALTKVALVAENNILKQCLDFYNAHALIFDSHGIKSLFSLRIGNETSQAV
jgi:thiamine biosynthesis lipoprotein